MSTKQIECDDDLLASLGKATPEELDVLVDIITDFARGRAGLDPDYKKTLVQAKYASRSSGYSEGHLRLLGRELQLFGGHSAMNLARRLLGKPAVSYAEIVDDVYWKLNGDQMEQKSTEDMEREIALALFGENWRELPPQERFERSTSVKVLSGLFSLKDALAAARTGAKLSSSGESRRSPLAVASKYLRRHTEKTLDLSNGAAAEAYRVTIPFVAQMGWIRLREDASAASQPAQIKAQAGTDEESGASDLVLRDANGDTLMTLNVIKRAPEGAGQAMSPEQVSTLNQLLTNVPGLAATAELHRGNYVVCSLPFEALTKSASDDGTVRGFVTTGGRIAEHAHLSTPDALQNVMISGAVWNVVSSAVAQKHLHDINEKLTAIKSQLDALQKDLEDQRWDKLAGLVNYMQSLLDHYPHDGVTEHSLTVLEMRQSELVELEQFFERKMSDELKHAESVVADKVLGVEVARGALQKSLSKMEYWVNGYLQAVQLRVVSCALSHKAQPLERYRSDAAKALGGLSQLNAKAAESYRVYGSQMELTNSRVFSLEESQRERFDKSLDALSNAVTTGITDTHRLHRMLFDQGEQRVLLQFENGRFTNGRLLDSGI